MTELLIANIPRMIVIAGLTVLSGVISASETALFSLTRQQLNRLRHAKTRSAAIVIALRENPTELLSTVLLCNIAVNILLYSVLGIMVSRFSEQSAAAATAFGVVGFFAVLFGAEIVPKLVAFSWCESLALLLAGPLRVMELATAPVRWALSRVFVEPLTKILSPTRSKSVQTDDLQKLLDISQRQGLIDDRESHLLHQLMDLSSLRVSSVMTPRVDVVAFDLNQSVETLKDLIRKHRLLRIPVYRDDVDNIVGIVSAKQLFLHSDRPVESMIRPVRFIPEQASCEAVLRHFRQTKAQVALVVDEYGGLAGLVAMEDLVETIVGDLRSPDERSDLPTLKRVDEKTFLADANLDVHDFCRAFELPEVETRIHTLGGLIAQELDRLPMTGDLVRILHARLTVTHMRNRRIMRVRISLDEPIADTPDLNVLLAQSESATPNGADDASAGRASS
ncbi:MAG: HlyC/CorC family transporter [Phycisphaerales bacterium]|nr:HlyC/CorC family transporter [Phycisphaerales bacterium]